MPYLGGYYYLVSVNYYHDGSNNRDRSEIQHFFVFLN